MNHHSQTPSTAARERILSLPHEPLVISDWLGVVMIHLEVEADALQRATPFPLDLWNGRAFVSLVAFTLRGMRPRFGGSLGKLLFKPMATHRFLNVRTYVRHGCETGIHFLAEWLNNRLAVQLGPPIFGLPYRLGRISYANELNDGVLLGRVVDGRNGMVLDYRADSEIGAPQFVPCAPGSLDEWLMERYTAFNCVGRCRRFFRVWHEPWPQVPVQIDLLNRSLLTRNWPFLAESQAISANYSPGVSDVWMGWPHRL